MVTSAVSRRGSEEFSEFKMSGERFFKIDPDSIEGGRVRICGEEFHHLNRVSGFEVGDTVKLLDGIGGLYNARIGEISSDNATLRVISSRTVPRPPPFDLALAVLRAGRMDLAVEKCVEVGLSKIITFTCQRSIWAGDETKANKKIERISRKVEAACKQSGQPYFAEVEGILDFHSLLEEVGNYSLVLMADKKGKKIDDGTGLSKDEKTLGIVGPEGGFTGRELRMLERRGVVPVSLGSYRLRSETAAISLLICMHSGHSW